MLKEILSGIVINVCVFIGTILVICLLFYLGFHYLIIPWLQSKGWHT